MRKIKFDTNTINHLGLRNYSSLPVALTEIVANCWDADATNVTVDIDITNRRIIIEDNGVGMSAAIIEDRFVAIGVDRRKQEASAMTKRGRLPLGRKGIGKLALFALAKKVDTATRTENAEEAFEIDFDELERLGHEEYEIPTLSEGDDKKSGSMVFPAGKTGTRILLTKLNRIPTKSTIDNVHFQLSRRFLMLKEDDFNIFINGELCELGKHTYLEKIKHIRWYGPEHKGVKQRLNPNAKEEEAQKVKAGEYHVTGWLGFVGKTTDLRIPVLGVNNNTISVSARGKIAKDDVLNLLNKTGVATNYLVGHINYDALEDDSKPDLATTGREDFYQDEEDKRLPVLMKFITDQVQELCNLWLEREKETNRKFLESHVAGQKWLAYLKELTNGGGIDHKKQATELFLRLAKSRSEQEKNELLSNLVVGYEYLRLSTDVRESIGKIFPDDDNLRELSLLWGKIEDLERYSTGQILRSRVVVIRKLEEITKDWHNNPASISSALEDEVRDFLFDNLWLINSQWDDESRIDKAKEQYIKGIISKAQKETDKKKTGFLDIAVREGEEKDYEVIELKRPTRNVNVGELTDQIRKYYDILDQNKTTKDRFRITCIVNKKTYDAWSDADHRAIIPYNATIKSYFQFLIEVRTRYTRTLDLYEKKGLDKVRSIIQLIPTSSKQQSSSI